MAVSVIDPAPRCTLRFSGPTSCASMQMSWFGPARCAIAGPLDSAVRRSQRRNCRSSLACATVWAEQRRTAVTSWHEVALAAQSKASRAPATLRRILFFCTHLA